MSEQTLDTRALAARRTRWTNLAILAGILLLANILGADLFLRTDLSGRNIYSLSSASKEVVRGLGDRLTIKAFFSRDLPAPYSNVSRYVKDKLDDYKAYARGMIHYEFTDPGTEEGLREEAAQHGIQPVNMQVVEQDKFEVKQAYLALVFLYEDRTETIPVVQSTAGLEYDITTAIRRVSVAELPVVGVLAGHGMPTPEEDLSSFSQQLRRHFQVRSVSIDSFSLIPPDVEILFIIGPKTGFDRWERYAIDQYIMRGGKSAWLMEMTNADLQQSQQGMAQPIDLGMDAWLMHYGIHLRTALVMDRYSESISMMQRQGFFQVRTPVAYPFFPRTSNFNTENAIVKDLPGVSFFYVSPVDTSLTITDQMRQASSDTLTSWPAAPPQLHVEPIIFSSEDSGLQEEFFFIQPNPAMARGQYRGGPYPLAAVVSGMFESAFEVSPAVPDTVTLPAHMAGPVENRLVLVGDSTFPQESYLGVQSGAINLQLVLNMVDWLNQDEALIAIRAKELDNRPLREVSSAVRAILKGLIFLLPPLLAILSGLLWWRYRRRRQQPWRPTQAASEGR